MRYFKKIISVVILLFILFAKTQAQNYKINFAGTGASTTVDSVKVENLTRCTDTIIAGSDTLNLTGTVKIFELYPETENKTDVYPNPMTSACSVDFETNAQCKTIIGLYDISGKIIIQEQDLLLKGHHKYMLHGVNSGFYTLKIESDKFLYSTKIISINSTFGNAEIKHIETIPCIVKQNTTSNKAKSISFKSGKSVIDMQYDTGDRLKFTGKSGNYRTIFMLVPTQNQTVSFNFVNCTDASNNNYAVVKIDTMIWMAENLKTSRYRNNDKIPNVTTDTSWCKLTTGAYCWYNNDSATYENSYSKLYNWESVNARNLCPIGWHVPTNNEWTTLTNYLGGEIISGGKLKENCSVHWNSPNTGATNSSGFTAIPGGFRYGEEGMFNNIGNDGAWWSSTESGTDTAWFLNMSYNSNDVSMHSNNKTFGFSVRCLRD